jgi:septation ring formation regulator EzrA
MFLPQEIKDKIPDDIVGVIESFMPKKSKKRKIFKQSIQREIEKLQKMKIKGMNDMFLKEFTDLVID